MTRPSAMPTHSRNRPLASMLSKWGRSILGLAVLASALSCRQDMHDQPKFKPLRPSTFFEDGTSARTLPAGTVARGRLREDDHLYTGKDNEGRLVSTFPFEITAGMLDRGQELFNVYCSVCHGPVGDGNGMVVQRGFRRPPSFHIERLRNAPVGHHFDVITNGLGAMLDYSAQVEAPDRWKIIAYIRALQLSQNSSPQELTDEQRRDLEQGGQNR